MPDNKTLLRLVQDLETAVADVGLRTVTIEDVETMLGHLREDMDNAAHAGNFQLSYREFHRTVRVLHELMRYTVDGLIDAHDKCYTTFLALHKKVGKEEAI